MTEKFDDSSKKCILYIDNQPEIPLGILNRFKDDYNYTIFTEKTVQSGLDLLDEHHGVIDSVILDLQFKEDKSQREDELLRIKQKYPFIPIFILADSDSLNEGKVKESMNNCAVIYYHKSNFDIKALLLQIDKVIGDSQRIRQLKNYQNILTNAPYLEIFDDCKSGFTGVFAFELVSVTISTELKFYSKWRLEVLQTLAVGFENLSITQLFYKNTDKQGIKIYLLFTLSENTKLQIASSFEAVFFNFSLFLNTTLDFQPVQFAPILDPLKLKEIISLDANKKDNPCYLYKRNSKKIKRLNEISGYGKTSNAQHAIDIPQYFTAEPKYFDLLFHQMNGLNSALLVTRIKKIKLNIDEVKTLSSIKSQLRNQEDVIYLATVNKLLHNREQLFQIETNFYTQTKNATAALNRVNNLFYENNASFRKINKKNTSDYLINNFFNRIPYLYSIETATNLLVIPAVKNEVLINHSQVRKIEVGFPYQFKNKNGVCFGEKESKKVYLDYKQFQKHTYIIGKTGTGKTSVLYTMLMDCITKGKGTALIDPHGDVFDTVIKNIPANRKKDVIIFEPTNFKNDFGFNILNYDKNFPEQQSFIVDELLKIFSSLYNMSNAGGPMFEMYFKNAAYLVMETIPNATLDDLRRVYSDDAFMNSCLQKCKNQRVLNFYKMVRGVTGESKFENFGPYITSKLTRFTDNYFLSRIVCDASKTFDFRKMIDEGKIFLVKLDRGRLGFEAVNFIGRILFNRIIMAAYTRSNIAESERKDYSLFVDEFQNFTSDDVVSALSEARKYHLQLVLANQTFAQLKRTVVKNILSNVGSIISAAVSPFDANTIVPFLIPEFNSQDIIQLDNFKFIVKTYYDNKRVAPFVFNSIPF